MDKDKITKVAIILVIAIIAIVAIVFISGNKKDVAGIETYIGRTNSKFENELIKDYKGMRKFTREKGNETVSKNYEPQNTLELFNETYFETKKVVAISISEDNGSDYEYHVDKLDYNADKTMVTVEYTNKSSGYNGSLSSSWNNCLLVEVEGTVTSVNFVEITE